MNCALRSSPMPHAATAAALLLLAACGGEPPTPALVEVGNPARTGAVGPHLAATAGGGAVLSWLEPDGDAHALRYAEWTDERWSEPRTLVRRDDLFVNPADFPSVVPIEGAAWAAHWLVRQPDSFAAYDIHFAVSGDGGESWSEPAPLNIDGTAAEHGFVSLFRWGEDIGAVWLDGRNLAEWDVAAEEDPDRFPGTSLRFARLDRDGTVLERGAIDELACDCCPTSVAIADTGPVVIYRDRSREEIRDIAVRRHGEAGWSSPIPLGPDGWEIAGCPVNGPAIAGRSSDLAAAWFTGAEGRARVRFARSSDGGRSFEAPLDVDAEGAFGHVDLALLEDGAAVVSWWRRTPDAGGSMLAARRIGTDGVLGPVGRVADSAAGQPLDMPQLVRTGGGLLFAWTEPGRESGIRTRFARHWP